MERHAILDLMAKLKLRGMRAAYDEVITLAAKRQHTPERVVAELLTAQLADVQSRATAYRMGNAKFPVAKALGEFDFAASPVNAALVRDLHRGDFLFGGRNAVLVGGTGSGKTHVSTAVPDPRPRGRRVERPAAGQAM
jgi:DNA replication protein DnaC